MPKFFDNFLDTPHDFWFVHPPIRTPSPGPWRVKKSHYRNPIIGPTGYEYVWVVLDANGKCVAECDDIENAIHIADMCTGGNIK